MEVRLHVFVTVSLDVGQWLVSSFDHCTSWKKRSLSYVVTHMLAVSILTAEPNRYLIQTHMWSEISALCLSAPQTVVFFYMLLAPVAIPTLPPLL